MAVTTECIIWTGALNGKGYGRRWDPVKRGANAVHKMVWEEANGPVPEGLFVCHHCDTPACYNIEHLFIDTPGGNMRDMTSKGRHWQQKKTHCPQGHLYSEENTYYYPKTGRRGCRECRRESNRQYRKRQKVAA